jgi:hypothetical protein
VCGGLARPPKIIIFLYQTLRPPENEEAEASLAEPRLASALAMTEAAYVEAKRRREL